MLCYVQLPHPASSSLLCCVWFSIDSQILRTTCYKSVVCATHKQEKKERYELDHKRIVRKVQKGEGKPQKWNRNAKGRKGKKERGQWGVELRVDVDRFSLRQPTSPSDTRPLVPHLSMSPLSLDLSIPHLSNWKSVSPVGWMRLKAIFHARLCWWAFARQFRASIKAKRLQMKAKRSQA